MDKIPTECISWRWNGNLGDDMIYGAQEAMFDGRLELGQYLPAPRAVLVGGGTLVPKPPEHPGLLDLSRRLPAAFFGTGIGDPLFWGTDRIPEWLEILGNARFVGVRGPLAKERLEEWGFPGDRVAWIGDPALYYARPEERTSPPQGKLAVNLGITYGKLYGFDEDALVDTVIGALKELVRTGWDLTLVCAWKPDDAVVERIMASVPVSAVEHWHDDYLTAVEAMGQFDLVLCEKLHVGVVAACRAVPFVALNYRSKVMDFCRSIGWEQFCLSTDRLRPDTILEAVTTLGQARETHAGRLRAGVSAVRERLLEAVPQTVAALGGSPT